MPMIELDDEIDASQSQIDPYGKYENFLTELQINDKSKAWAMESARGILNGHRSSIFADLFM